MNLGSEHILVGDVGGTNVRFAVAQQGKTEALELVDPLRLVVSDFAGFDDALAAYLETLGSVPSMASFALAGPKFDDQIRMTNINWIASETEIESKFPFENVNIVNDFVAMARGVAAIHAYDRETGLANVLGGELNFNQTVCVLGPGTGMGVAAILPSQSPDRYVRVQPTEGGHTAFAPQTDHEVEIMRVWKARLGFVSAEVFLSGGGIFRLYSALCEIEGIAPIHGSQEAVVAAAGNDPNGIAKRTLDLFCAMLGTFAANTALTMGASGGVVIAGGVGRHIAPFLEGSDFERRFYERGHGSWFVKNVPVHRLEALFVPLHGAAALMIDRSA